MVFNYSGKVYSISDKNEKGEFVVVKLSGDGKTIEDARVAKAATKAHVRKRIRAIGFSSMLKLPGFEKETIETTVN